MFFKKHVFQKNGVPKHRLSQKPVWNLLRHLSSLGETFRTPFRKPEKAFETFWLKPAHLWENTVHFKRFQNACKRFQKVSRRSQEASERLCFPTMVWESSDKVSKRSPDLWSGARCSNCFTRQIVLYCTMWLRLLDVVRIASNCTMWPLPFDAELALCNVTCARILLYENSANQKGFSKMGFSKICFPKSVVLHDVASASRCRVRIASNCTMWPLPLDAERILLYENSANQKCFFPKWAFQKFVFQNMFFQNLFFQHRFVQHRFFTKSVFHKSDFAKPVFPNSVCPKLVFPK